MQLLSQINIETNEETIRKIISTQGHAAEHNYNHYLNIGQMIGECTFAVIEGPIDAKGVRSFYGIMSFKENDNTAWCYSDPLAPKEKRADVFLQFVEWSFANGFSKIRSEINEITWNEVIQKIKSNFSNKFRCVKPSYIYQWPVYDLKKWDPSLPGSHWKTLRNIKNYFSKNHKIEIFQNDAKGAGSLTENISTEEILKLLKNWKKMRAGADKAYTEQYESAIKSNFEGYDSVRIILVDGKIAVLSGGWKVPKSNIFYLQLGIPNYEIKNIGDFSYLDDLEFLKSNGYDFADFGGSSPEMMAFKNKFNPAYAYKTVEFSVMQKK